MEGEMLQLLMSGGANVAFAVFLYTQNKDLQRRADEREAKAEIDEEEGGAVSVGHTSSLAVILAVVSPLILFHLI